jgi:hypothetical protein
MTPARSTLANQDAPSGLLLSFGIDARTTNVRCRGNPLECGPGSPPPFGARCFFMPKSAKSQNGSTRGSVRVAERANPHLHIYGAMLATLPRCVNGERRILSRPNRNSRTTRGAMRAFTCGAGRLSEKTASSAIAPTPKCTMRTIRVRQRLRGFAGPAISRFIVAGSICRKLGLTNVKHPKFSNRNSWLCCDHLRAFPSGLISLDWLRQMPGADL